MIDGEVEMELKVPKSLIVALWVIGVGLVLNGVQPFLGTPANASGGIQKMAICDMKGRCADMVNTGSTIQNGMTLGVFNFGR